MKPSKQILETMTPIVTAAESRKEGYLARKFIKIRQQQKEQIEREKAVELEQISKVRTIARTK